MSFFWKELESFLSEGGVVLWLILILSIYLYALIAYSFLDYQRVSKEMKGGGVCESIDQLNRELLLFELEWTTPLKGRKKTIKVLIGVVILLGLLGTVLGMLEIFFEIGNSGGTQTFTKGISKALVTTQMGLVFAIPALFLNTLIGVKNQKMESDLERVYWLQLKKIKLQNRA